MTAVGSTVETVSSALTQQPLVDQEGDPYDQPVVRVQEVSKCFRLYDSVTDRFLDLMTGKRQRATEFWALRDISFEIKRGECFAIVGANGSGKSTLLKILTGTLLPTDGTVATSGRVLALLELGAGMNPELTGRENVLASAALLGFPSDYAPGRLREIEEFADIGDFFDRPVKIYSSGMFVRVAFSIFLFMEPDIFIIDEALSVGDVFFQQKCFRALKGIIASGTTVLFVSHDMGAVQTLCNRALLLERGHLLYTGRPNEVVNRYYSALGRKTSDNRERSDPRQSLQSEPKFELPVLMADIEATGTLAPTSVTTADGSLEVVAARIVNSEGHSVVALRCGESVIFQAVLRATLNVDEPDLSLTLYDRFGRSVFGTSPAMAGRPIRSLAAGESVVVAIDVKMTVAIGQYTYAFTPTGARGSIPDLVADDGVVMLGPIVVFWDEPTSLFYGIGGLPASIVSNPLDRDE